MNPIERALRCVDRYQQRHSWLGFLFAVVKKFGDDKGGNLTTLLAWNGFFALFPLLLILVTTLGFLLGRHPDLEQRVLHSTLAEFPILGDQLQKNVHSLRANGIGLIVGLAGFLWGARGITQAGQHAMAEIWNIPGKQRPSFATRQLRGLLLLLVFGLGVVATTALASLPSFGGHSLLVVVGTWSPRRRSTPRCCWSPSACSPLVKSPLGSYSWARLWPGCCLRCCRRPAGTWSATTSSTPSRCTDSSRSCSG
jgi:uncharacterized BrkB/YihY/UPF0761 family membrane protein